MKNGIDVSKHNGEIDWKSVKESGKMDFAILRAGARASLLLFMHSALSWNSNS